MDSLPIIFVLLLMYMGGLATGAAWLKRKQSRRVLSLEHQLHQTQLTKFYADMQRAERLVQTANQRLREMERTRLH